MHWLYASINDTQGPPPLKDSQSQNMCYNNVYFRRNKPLVRVFLEQGSNKRSCSGIRFDNYLSKNPQQIKQQSN